MLENSSESLAFGFDYSAKAYGPDLARDGVIKRIKSIWESTDGSQSQGDGSVQTRLNEMSYVLNEVVDSAYLVLLLERFTQLNVNQSKNQKELTRLKSRMDVRVMINKLTRASKERKEFMSHLMRVPPDFLPRWYIKHYAKLEDLPAWFVKDLKK
jgi:hypothetical protein